MTDDGYLQPAVAGEFASLASLLEDAAPAQWDTPSLRQAGGSAKWSRT